MVIPCYFYVILGMSQRIGVLLPGIYLYYYHNLAFINGRERLLNYYY